jgi:hypothetical protein
MKRHIPVVLAGTALLVGVAVAVAGPPKAVNEPRPVVNPDPGPSPTLGARPPRIDDRTLILFDGTAWSGWQQRDGTPSQWEVQADGSALVRNGDAITTEEVSDFQLHLEFFCPLMANKKGQARANSGVYLHGRYEVQVLDTYGKKPFGGGCGAIYSIAPPLVNASRPPDNWQTYDILFRAPRLDDAGEVIKPAVITVLHNGVVIHNNLELPHATPGGLDKEVVAAGPLLLQDHGDAVRYRNIWMRRLD